VTGGEKVSLSLETGLRPSKRDPLTAVSIDGRWVQSVHRLTRLRDIGESPPENLHAALNSQLYNT